MQLKIVISGAPGSGKTVLTRTLVDRHPDQLALVPEAATQVYAARNTRWDRLDVDQQRDAQRAIYRLQIEQEDRIAREHPSKHLILDRGTLDGAAYWPDGPEAYWADLGTTLEAQLSRYHKVILLETAAAIGLYDGDESNHVRFESPAAAIEAGKPLWNLWHAHPRIILVKATHDLIDKFAALETLVLGAIRELGGKAE